VEFRVLGPLEVRDQGTVVDLGPPRIRVVCGLLLARPGELVGVERFVDELWPVQPPQDARALVRDYVSRLRRALRSGPSGAQRVVTRKPGYLLRIEDQELDLQRFEQLVADARAAERPHRAVELFRLAHDLWRGEPFADVPRTPSIAAIATWLTERRLTTREEQFDAALAAGQHADIVTGLTEFVGAYPLRERPAGQLMLALYRCGRQAEALEQYQRTQRVLAEDVGVDPGADLRGLHQQILNAVPALDHDAGEADDEMAMEIVTRTPHQLPRDLPTFVSRQRELASLAALLEAGTNPVVVVHGGPGVGKSALATRAAHLAASRYPDGQLHVSLQGSTSEVAPLSAGEALRQLLRSMGIAGTDLPDNTGEAAAMLRTVVAGRRLLVVLDNAANAAQVRPLLAGCAVLVTSRTRLVALEGAAHLHVGPLSPDAACAMLGRLVPDVRPAAEPEATRRLAQLCDYLPLGLHVAAARLNARSSWAVRDLVDRLADERHRLTELAAGDIAVRSNLAVSHTALHDSDNPTDQRAARALCVFGLLPITDVDLDLAAAVLGTTPTETDQTIERLLDGHLVEEAPPGRFHMHDLTRLFAHEQSASTIPPNEQHAVLIRLLSYYLATTSRANMLVYRHRAHHPAAEVTASPKPLAGHEEALRWLDEQRRNMIATARQAWRGPVEHLRLGVDLALALHWYLQSGANDLPDTTTFLREVVTAAERLGDRRSRAYAHGNLAGNLKHMGRLEEARTHRSTELALCQEINDRFGEQRALGNLGHTYLSLRRPEQAIPYLQRQLEVARDIDAPIGQAFALVNLGKAHHQLGRSADAITIVERGLAWYERTGDRYRQCDALEILAKIHIDLGRHDHAIELTTRGLDYARQIDYRFGEIWALTTLARAHRLSGDTDKARRYAEQAIRASNNFHGTQARTDALTEHARLSPDT
jgi:DNA-binding SARP family transcriptional activator/tetratricopeptide (TPR) repeat protein